MIERDDRRNPGQSGFLALQRLVEQRFPGRIVVAAPALEAEPRSQQAGCGIAGDPGCLYGQRARAAHRVAESAACGRQRGPVAPQQNCRGEVFLDRRAGARRAVAAFMQAVAGQIQRDAYFSAVHVHVDPHVRRRGIHRRPLAECFAQLVDHAVLDPLLGEPAVVNGRLDAGEVHRQRVFRAQMIGPVDCSYPGVQGIVVAGFELGQRQQDAIGHPRPQAGPIGPGQVRFKGNAAAPHPHCGQPEPGQLLGQQFFQPAWGGCENRLVLRQCSWKGMASL